MLNDPNGFCYYNGKYHLFYQWFPFGAVHGMKHWYHLTSADLVDWQEEGVALMPEFPHESHGIFSGTGFVEEEQLYLFYTGNHRNETWQRRSSQCLAILSSDGKIEKVTEPVISGPPKQYTHNFRDPKVFKKGNHYYMLVGAQREALEGCLLVYVSDDLKSWKFKQELKTNHESFGFMWECPDYFSLQGQEVLLVSPQGLKAKGNDFQNIYHSGVFIGEFDEQMVSFDTHAFQELDKGFDFYAPQTTQTPDGRQILIGWMGLPDTDYPSDKDGWANCLTTPRELSIKNGRIQQQPLQELKQKRVKTKHQQVRVASSRERLKTIFSEAGEYQVTIKVEDAKKAGIAFSVGENEETVCLLDRESKYFSLDRTQSGIPVATDFGTVRKMIYQQPTIQLTIFLDQSSIEVFVNDGEAVFSSRIFPKEDSRFIELFAENGTAQIDITQWSYE
ncbi:sucrose-6-phosphate hydrolase [Enterococcus moraviensis]|nr:sucrose-6-phosphate hydrolase [Enterococcus moraviensis]